MTTILVNSPHACHHSGDLTYIISNACHSSEKADINVPISQAETPREEVSKCHIFDI